MEQNTKDWLIRAGSTLAGGAGGYLTAKGFQDPDEPENGVSSLLSTVGGAALGGYIGDYAVKNKEPAPSITEAAQPKKDWRGIGTIAGALTAPIYPAIKTFNAENWNGISHEDAFPVADPKTGVTPPSKLPKPWAGGTLVEQLGKIPAVSRISGAATPPELRHLIFHSPGGRRAWAVGLVALTGLAGGLGGRKLGASFTEEK